MRLPEVSIHTRGEIILFKYFFCNIDMEMVSINCIYCWMWSISRKIHTGQARFAPEWKVDLPSRKQDEMSSIL